MSQARLDLLFAPVLAQSQVTIPPLTTGMLVMFGILGLAFVLFVTEPLPIDVVAVGLLVTLVVLEPWTGVSPVDGVSGFSSPATVTVLAMFILSEGIRRTGIVNIVGGKIADTVGDSPLGQLVAVLGLSGGAAGFINNTPVVAVMIPMVRDLSERTGVSPSKLLMPVSFASMLGGMLTLIGTSTNILASDVTARIGEENPDLGLHAFSMFEFTQLGAVVLVTGILYIVLVGRHLLPERISVDRTLADEFEMAEYLAEVAVTDESPLLGKTIAAVLRDLDVDVDVVQLVRDGHTFSEPLARKQVRKGDTLVLRTDRDSLLELVETQGLEPVSDRDGGDGPLGSEGGDGTASTPRHLVEVVVTPGTSLVGETLRSLDFRRRFEATVLAIRRGGALIHARMDERRLEAGDTLLVQATDEAIRRLSADRRFVVTERVERPDFRRSKIPLALGIVGAVVALAALELISITIAALGGVVAMVATGCVRPSELYRAVDWSVIFLLAGLIPLGIAMEATGTADWLATVIVAGSLELGLSAVLVLGLFYVVTALLTEVVSNNASVVLMIPVAAEAAGRIGANAFAFVLAVTFAASTAMLTPIGYQTNLMVYGPGGYEFTDFTRMGAPLQVLLAVVTTAGIVYFWGV